ncbi:unnamed protein product [Prorocentrum cordatum]|uniref:Uncharacterized protein n=1 Tax=Prorocentrum cordatum TaxID=2364126 RepID=A0ABN9WNR4_9DINO|nr:unnamed protein product [Polarella glacialis]
MGVEVCASSALRSSELINHSGKGGAKSRRAGRIPPCHPHVDKRTGSFESIGLATASIVSPLFACKSQTGQSRRFVMSLSIDNRAKAQLIREHLFLYSSEAQFRGVVCEVSLHKQVVDDLALCTKPSDSPPLGPSATMMVQFMKDHLSQPECLWSVPAEMLGRAARAALPGSLHALADDIAAACNAPNVDWQQPQDLAFVRVLEARPENRKLAASLDAENNKWCIRLQRLEVRSALPEYKAVHLTETAASPHDVDLANFCALADIGKIFRWRIVMKAARPELREDLTARLDTLGAMMPARQDDVPIVSQPDLEAGIGVPASDGALALRTKGIMANFCRCVHGANIEVVDQWVSCLSMETYDLHTLNIMIDLGMLQEAVDDFGERMVKLSPDALVWTPTKVARREEVMPNITRETGNEQTPTALRFDSPRVGFE